MTLVAPRGSVAEGPPEIRVGNDAELAAAVLALGPSGGTILLEGGPYRDEVTVSTRSARVLRIEGEQPGARIQTIRLDRARNVSIGHLTVTPLGRDATIVVQASERIDLHDLVVTAAGTRLTASIAVADSGDVTLRQSDLSHCGDLSPAFANCLLLRPGSRNVTVEDDRFHDCRGCDFVHGRFRSGLTIARNRFERALPCTLGGRRCRHQDLVELFAGDDLLVTRNVFGLYREGGAQLYLTGDMSEVTVVDNVFYATDPYVPGYRVKVGLVVGSAGRSGWCRSVRSRSCLPRRVRVLNNTILSGARRIDGYAGSLRMSSRYGGLPKRERPLLANNVIALLTDRAHVCSEARATVGNVVLRGLPCSRSDRVGDAHLDARGRPTAASTLLIDRAARRFAPRTDFDGHGRRGAPDIGAFEYRGRRR